MTNEKMNAVSFVELTDEELQEVYGGKSLLSQVGDAIGSFFDGIAKGLKG